MVRPRLRSAPVWALLASAAGLMGWLIESRTATGTGDYAGHGPWGDNAGPAIEAIIHGHVGALPRVQTVMGLTSILWRVPFVAITNALGAGDRIDYSVGALACLAPLLWVLASRIAGDPTRPQLSAAAIAAVVMIVGPATSGAVTAGHPEEVLTTVLALAAVLAAQAERRLTAAILLGLAIGAKQWALLAAPVVVLAVAQQRRFGVAAVAGVIAAATSLPLPLLDPAAFHHADAQIAPITFVQPMSLWWPLATSAGHLPFGMQRPLAAAAAFAVAAAAVCGAGVWLRARGGRAAPRPVDALALLTLVGLLRCLLDPATLGYYFVAATIPLAVWEIATERRPPAASVLFWGLLSLTRTGAVPFALTRAPLAGEIGNVIFLSGAGALAGYLTRRTFCGPWRIPARVGRPRAALHPPASPAQSV